MIVYLDGEYLPRENARISPEDRGFLFADAIYEVVRFHRGRGYHLAEHVERMRDGLAAVRIAADPGFFPEVAGRLLKENGLADADAIVYAQVSRGAAPRTHAFPPAGTKPTVFAFARASDPEPPAGGGKAILVPDERWGRCDIKTVMLLPNILAAQAAREAGAVDAILTRDGIAWEGTKANLFCVCDGVVTTAPNGHRILPGVTRGATLEAARRLGLTVEERPIPIDDLFSAGEVFLASTTLWTYPLVEIGGRRIGDGKPGRVTEALKSELRREFSK
ncbi:MAG TPA: aminotransferase class IV [Thermoanaerobaculia bacterium]|nr:aminotransferase class IV [Thermoanaerobaculia bacterium]